MSVAGIGPRILKKRGLIDVEELRSLGFSSIDIRREQFTLEAVSLFGAIAVRKAFITNSSDAAIIAGSNGVCILGLDVTDLLNLCIRCPGDALEVLLHMEPKRNALHQTPCSVLLNTGLQKVQLEQAGYGLSELREQVNPTLTELRLLGFAGFFLGLTLKN